MCNFRLLKTAISDRRTVRRIQNPVKIKIMVQKRAYGRNEIRTIDYANIIGMYIWPSLDIFAFENDRKQEMSKSYAWMPLILLLLLYYDSTPCLNPVFTLLNSISIQNQIVSVKRCELKLIYRVHTEYGSNADLNLKKFYRLRKP